MEFGRYQWIDIARGIGIILVIVGHTSSNSILVKAIYEFHMPLFFFVSGYLFNYARYENNFSLFVNTKVNRLLLPYFFTCIISYSLWYISYKTIKSYTFTSLSALSTSPTLSASPIDGLISIFYGNGASNHIFANYILYFNYALWFLICLFSANIIMYIFIKYDNGNIKLNIVYCIIIVISGYIISKYIFLPWGIDIALVSLGFMYFGYLMKIKNIIPTKLGYNGLYICILSTALFSLAFFMNDTVDMNWRLYGNLFLFFMGAFSGIALLIIIALMLQSYGSINGILTFFGKSSLIILAVMGFMPGYILKAISFLNIRLYDFIYYNNIIHIIYIIAISTILVYIISNTKYLNKIYN